jgi:hypothetical protein
MTADRNRITKMALAALLALAVAYIVFLHVRLHHYDIRPYIGHDDAPLIDRTYRIIAQRHGLPVERMKQDSYAVSMRLADRKCIQISPTMDAVGEQLVFCYDRAGRLVEEF